MAPCCSAPSRLPAPRISRSRNAVRGHQLADPLGRSLDGAHSVMDEIHLAATLDLSFDHLFDELVIVRGHIGLDRLAVFWWRLHNAHVADAGDRHMQCARNRSRRQRENVDLRPEPLQALLLNDDKSLLFVDYY